MKLFDYLKTINEDKNYVMDSFDEEIQKKYPAFMVNMAMSLRMETILFANEMNERHFIPNKWNYDYYFHSLDKQKRYASWPKKAKEDNIDIIVEYYKVNKSRAIEYLQILSENDINLIKSKLYKGGRT